MANPTTVSAGIGTLLIAVVLAGVTPATSEPVSTDITILCDLSYDTVSATNDPGTAHIGEIALIHGGGETSSSFLNGSVTGLNPLSGIISTKGNGVVIRDITTFSIAGETRAGIDAVFSITNRSLFYGYDITFLITFTNRTQASGPNAFVHSELTIDEEYAEVFFSDIESDTVYGNQINGDPSGGFGSQVSEIGQTSLTVTVPAGETRVLAGDWTTRLAAGEGGSIANGAFNGSITLASTVPVDTDGDGFNDLEEDIAGTNPNNSNDVFRADIGPQGMTLNWFSAPDRIYTVYASTNLLSGFWIPITTVAATPPLNSIPVNPLSSGAQAEYFYIDVMYIMP